MTRLRTPAGAKANAIVRPAYLRIVSRDGAPMPEATRWYVEGPYECRRRDGGSRPADPSPGRDRQAGRGPGLEAADDVGRVLIPEIEQRRGG
jgi:hypothetical protein